MFKILIAMPLLVSMLGSAEIPPVPVNDEPVVIGHILDAGAGFRPHAVDSACPEFTIRLPGGICVPDESMFLPPIAPASIPAPMANGPKAAIDLRDLYERDGMMELVSIE